jgi:diaminohydroxyphosphoribosylaminopyrimidine deaminase/5-amino-6-(5-phosphoribosylamino)uracil reductase
MQRALGLAQAQLGRTAPNPSVGCVIVLGDAIVGEGATGHGGRPHAEEIALAAAGPQAQGATAYVTLEPCNQRSGGTQSCSQLLLSAGLARVVIACPDPHPLGAHGAERLKAAGIRTETGLMQAEAMQINAGFFKRLAIGRPLLAIDGDAASYDAEFDLGRNESYEQALDRLGASGLTRVFVRPGTALAAQLKARGLVDHDNSG